MASKLFIQRLRVLTRHGDVAYDEHFHKGINIIRGDNSSGKSTITHLLFYGLGGSYVDFVPQAKLCQYVYVEVRISDCILTLKREIKLTKENRVETMTGMHIFWGNMDEAITEKCESQYFGYKATGKIKSFSNALFEILGFPIVVGDSNITMHQLLRLMYIDQESPTSSLFMFETFDSQITRETVAELLMGIYDSELYNAKLSLRDLHKQLTDVSVETKAVKAALPRSEESSSAFIQSIIDNKEIEIQSLAETIQQKRAGTITNVPKFDNLARLKKEIAHLRKSISEQEELVERINNEINDTTLLLMR